MGAEAAAAAGSVLSGIGGIVSSVGGLIQNKKQRVLDEKHWNKDYAFQREQYSYQKKLQNTLFQREDNAVQRRVEDLERAGLSKTLAAGSAASAGQAVHVTSRQPRGYETDAGAGAKAVGQSLQSIGQVLQNTLQIKSMANQVLQGEESIANTRAERDRIQAEILIKGQELLDKQWNNKVAQTLGLPVGATPTQGIQWATLGAKAMNEFKEQLDEKMQKFQGNLNTFIQNPLNFEQYLGQFKHWYIKKSSLQDDNKKEVKK